MEDKTREEPRGAEARAMSKPTPPPWEGHGCAIYGPDGLPLASAACCEGADVDTFDEEWRETSQRTFGEAWANVELIVRAVNGYEAQRELIGDARRVISSTLSWFTSAPAPATSEQELEVIEFLRAALSKLEAAEAPEGRHDN